jgi:hypothetical protein|tara:strand:- start:12242 stop:13921 length:1680 start_codon:yes stop_codon:yes gene_type:complete
MPVNKTVIKIVVEGAPNAKQQLEALGKANEKVNKKATAYNRLAGKMRGTTSGLTRAMGRLRNTLLLVGFAFGGVLAAIRKTTKAYRQQVEAEAKLAAGLRNVSGATVEGTQKLIDYAAQLQKTTTFGDENIISGMAMLATFQLNEAAIAKLTPRLLDMAASQPGMQDLATTAIQLGKAFTGMPSALTRSGVVIDKVGLSIARAKGPTEEFNFLIEQLDDNFQGIAESLAQTTIGQLDQLENEISDINEKTGQLALPAELTWAKTKKELAALFSYWSTVATKTWSDEISFNEALKMAEEERIKLVEAGNIAFKQFSIDRTKEIQKQLMLSRQSIDLVGEEMGLAKDGNLSLRDRIDLLETQRKHLDELRGLGTSNIEPLITEEEHQQKVIQNDIKRISLQEQLKHSQLNAASSMIGSFAALNEAAGGNAEASAKLAQIAAIIDMYAGANKAYQQGGMLGFAGAAAIIAAGTANVINIQKQMGQMKKAATGASFVTDGPQMMLVGEQGREQVNVTPLEGPNIAGPQTSPVSINITGNVLSNEFVMDDVIPAIRQAATINLA